MADGIVRVTEKPVVDSMKDVDYLIGISEGAVCRVESTIGEGVSITDTDHGNVEYACRLLVRNGHLVLVGETTGVQTYMIPAGRMLGDVNGDGKITQEDYTLLNDYISRTATLDTVGQWCADINNDGSVLSTDAAQLTRYLSGLSNALTGVPTLADYNGNWTYVKVDDLTGYWTYSLRIDSEDEVGAVTGYDKTTGYSVSGDVLTVTVSAPPVVETEIQVRAADGQSGNGTR